MTYSTEGFERIIFRIEGVEAVTHAIGEGPPLVYLHGGGTFHGFEWARALADRFRVYCPHHPNFGDSADADFTGIADYVAHCELLFPALGLDSFHLAGASLGGHIAARFAAANPGDIERLALIAPAGLRSADASGVDLGKVAPRDIPALLAADPAWLERFWPADPSPEWLALRQRESAAAAALREDPAADDAALRSSLKGFDRPTLLLWGEADRIAPAALAREWQRAIPQAEPRLIPGGSHLLLDEFPEAVAALRDWLEG